MFSSSRTRTSSSSSSEVGKGSVVVMVIIISVASSRQCSADVGPRRTVPMSGYCSRSPVVSTSTPVATDCDESTVWESVPCRRGHSMDYQKDPRVDDYISALPEWQQEICQEVRDLVHAAD